MNNRGETIYLDTSIFEAILSKDNARRECSLKLLELCASQNDFIGFLSPFTIFELKQKGTGLEIDQILEVAHNYRIKYIEYSSPQEIDILTQVYFNQKLLSNEFEFTYFHLASAAYLNIGHYATWNENLLVNYDFERNLLISHRFNGYRPNIKITTPKYFVSHKGKFDEWKDPCPTKETSLASLNAIELNKRTSFVQDAISDLTSKLEKSILPSTDKNTSRQPTIEVSSKKLKLQMKDFSEEIEEKKIPLLDLNHNDTNFGMDYHLFQLKVIDGSLELKNRLLKLIQNLPLFDSQEEMTAHNYQNNLDFINWIIPQIRSLIETSEIPKGHLKEIVKYSHREIDTQLYYSISTESIHTAKQKALELALFITGNAWQYYECFKTHESWCTQNEGFEYGTISHFIIDKEGKEIWVILMNSIIP